MIRKLFVCGLLMVANLLAFGGCFAYVPVEPAAAPVGQEVRVYITPQEMAALRELDDQGLPYSNGPPSVSGILTSRDGSGLTLRIPVATRQNSLLRSSIFRNVEISPSSVVQFELRQLDRGRTALAVATTGGLAAGIVASILGNAQPPTVTGGPGDDGLGMHVPLFSFSIP